MKVDTSRLKKGTSEVPTECQTLIDKLRSCSMDELLEELRKIDTWTFGKSELYHWIDVLDIFDGILEESTKQIGNDWFLACDERFSPKKIQLLLAVLNFTTLLIEHSFSRHLYNSVEHLTQLLSSTNMEIVLGVLNLLYMFSKRSNFIPRLNCAKRNALLFRLTYIAEVSINRLVAVVRAQDEKKKIHGQLILYFFFSFFCVRVYRAGAVKNMAMVWPNVVNVQLPIHSQNFTTNTMTVMVN